MQQPMKRFDYPIRVINDHRVVDLRHVADWLGIQPAVLQKAYAIISLNLQDDDGNRMLTREQILSICGGFVNPLDEATVTKELLFAFNLPIIPQPYAFAEPVAAYHKTDRHEEEE